MIDNNTGGSMQIFKDRYQTIANDWNLNRSVCTRIINRYSKKLEEEMADNSPVILPPSFKDRRTDKEYIFDLIEGWIIEDFILAWFRNRIPGLKTSRAGKDSNRRIRRKSHGKISSRPDLHIITPRGCKRPLEVQVSRLEGQARFDVKTSKFDYLRRKGGMIIFVLLHENRFFIVYPRHILELGLQPAPNPCFGGKMTYCFTRKDIEKIGLHRLDGDLPDGLCKRLGIQ